MVPAAHAHMAVSPVGSHSHGRAESPLNAPAWMLDMALLLYSCREP